MLHWLVSAPGTLPGVASLRSLQLHRRSSGDDVGSRIEPSEPAFCRRSEEHTSELQSRENLVCRLLLDPAPPLIYTLSLHDALPISSKIISPSDPGSLNCSIDAPLARIRSWYSSRRCISSLSPASSSKLWR